MQAGPAFLLRLLAILLHVRCGFAQTVLASFPKGQIDTTAMHNPYIIFQEGVQLGNGNVSVDAVRGPSSWRTQFASRRCTSHNTTSACVELLAGGKMLVLHPTGVNDLSWTSAGDKYTVTLGNGVAGNHSVGLESFTLVTDVQGPVLHSAYHAVSSRDASLAFHEAIVPRATSHHVLQQPYSEHPPRLMMPDAVLEVSADPLVIALHFDTVVKAGSGTVEVRGPNSTILDQSIASDALFDGNVMLIGTRLLREALPDDIITVMVSADAVVDHAGVHLEQDLLVSAVPNVDHGINVVRSTLDDYACLPASRAEWPSSLALFFDAELSNVAEAQISIETCDGASCEAGYSDANTSIVWSTDGPSVLSINASSGKLQANLDLQPLAMEFLPGKHYSLVLQEGVLQIGVVRQCDLDPAVFYQRPSNCTWPWYQGEACHVSCPLGYRVLGTLTCAWPDILGLSACIPQELNVTTTEVPVVQHVMEITVVANLTGNISMPELATAVRESLASLYNVEAAYVQDLVLSELQVGRRLEQVYLERILEARYEIVATDDGDIERLLASAEALTMTGGNASEFFIKSLEENMPELKVSGAHALEPVIARATILVASDGLPVDVPKPEDDMPWTSSSSTSSSTSSSGSSTTSQSSHSTTSTSNTMTTTTTSTTVSSSSTSSSHSSATSSSTSTSSTSTTTSVTRSTSTSRTSSSSSSSSSSTSSLSTRSSITSSSSSTSSTTVSSTQTSSSTSTSNTTISSTPSTSTSSSTRTSRTATTSSSTTSSTQTIGSATTSTSSTTSTVSSSISNTSTSRSSRSTRSSSSSTSSTSSSSSSSSTTSAGTSSTTTTSSTTNTTFRSSTSTTSRITTASHAWANTSNSTSTSTSAFSTTASRMSTTTTLDDPPISGPVLQLDFPVISSVEPLESLFLLREAESDDSDLFDESSPISSAPSMGPDLVGSEMYGPALHYWEPIADSDFDDFEDTPVRELDMDEEPDRATARRTAWKPSRSDRIRLSFMTCESLTVGEEASAKVTLSNAIPSASDTEPQRRFHVVVPPNAVVDSSGNSPLETQMLEVLTTPETETVAGQVVFPTERASKRTTIELSFPDQVEARFDDRGGDEPLVYVGALSLGRDEVVVHGSSVFLMPKEDLPVGINVVLVKHAIFSKRTGGEMRLQVGTEVVIREEVAASMPSTTASESTTTTSTSDSQTPTTESTPSTATPRSTTPPQPEPPSCAGSSARRGSWTTNCRSKLYAGESCTVACPFGEKIIGYFSCVDESSLLGQSYCVEEATFLSNRYAIAPAVKVAHSLEVTLAAGVDLTAAFRGSIAAVYSVDPIYIQSVHVTMPPSRLRRLGRGSNRQLSSWQAHVVYYEIIAALATTDSSAAGDTMEHAVNLNRASSSEQSVFITALSSTFNIRILTVTGSTPQDFVDEVLLDSAGEIVDTAQWYGPPQEPVEDSSSGGGGSGGFLVAVIIGSVVALAFIGCSSSYVCYVRHKKSAY